MSFKRNRFVLAASSSLVVAAVLSATLIPISLNDASAAKVKPAHGAPINFAGFCGASAPSIVPGCWEIVQAVFKNYNKDGGYKGRPLDFTYSDANDATDFSANVQKYAENSHYLAFLGAFSDAGIGAVTQPLHMAVVGDGGLSSDDATYSNLFSLSAYSRGSGVANVQYYLNENSDVNPFGVFLNISAGIGAWATVSNILSQADGNEAVPTSPIALTATSFDPIAVLISANHYDPVVVFAIGSQIAGIVQATAALGVHTTFIQSFTCVDDDYLQTVASISGEKLFCAAPWNLSIARTEVSAALKEAKISFNFDFYYAVIENYLAAKMAIKALSLVKGPLTRASFLKAMSSMTFSDPAMLAPVNFSKPGPDPTAPSYRQYLFNVFQVINGKLVQQNVTPVNDAP